LNVNVKGVHDEHVIGHLEELFDAIVGKVLDFVKSKCQEYQVLPENALVT
jgi:hypothetical protein